jgi:PAS domain S-box-containing protein
MARGAQLFATDHSGASAAEEASVRRPERTGVPSARIRPARLDHPELPALGRYAIALVLGAVAAIGIHLGATLPHAPFFLAWAVVVPSAWIGGFGPGVLTALLAGLAVHFSPPPGGLVGPWPSDTLPILVFLSVATALSWFVTSCVRNRGEVERLNRVLERQILQLRGLFEIVPVGIAVAHDPECRTITSNPTAAGLLGVTTQRNISLSGPAPDRVAYRMLRDGKEIAPEELPLQRAAARQTGVETEELEIELPDGRSFTVYCCAAPIVGADGAVTGSIGAFLDVSGQRRAAAELLASEERLRLAMEAADLHSWDWDLRTGAIRWSPGAEPFLGPSPGRFEAVYETFLSLVHPDDRIALQTALARALWAGESFDLQYRLIPAGQDMWVEVRGKVLRDEAGDPTKMIGVNFDVTARVRSEQERERLLASERAARAEADRAQRRLRRLADSRLIGVIFVEGELITEANDAFLELLGYSREDLAGGLLTWHDLSPPERIPLDQGALQEVLERGECTPYETEWCRRDGSRVPIILGAALLGENPIEAVAFVLDITSRRRAETERDASLERERAARLEAEAATRAKDDFLAVVSHELRSPLTAIRMWTGVLRRERAGSDTGRILDAIDRSTVAQTRVIEDLLDVSRIVAGTLHLEFEAVDLGDIVRRALESIEPAATHARIRLATSLDPGLVVWGDAARLEQVVSNLLSNAVKFSPSDTEVEVRLAGGAEATLSVRDHGKGIDRAFLPHVFERFRQADASRTRETSGLGLGLAIARHLVVAHGGQITAESPGPAQGATFTVRLPLHAVERRAPGVRRRESAARGPAPEALVGVRVLVVDDDLEARESITAVLRTAGARPTAVDSAEAALQAFEREVPHVLLADIAMPREDGFTLLRRVRALEKGRGGDVPAAAVTAHGGRAERQLALQRGFQALLTKPVAAEELVATVSELAAARGA